MHMRDLTPACPYCEARMQPRKDPVAQFWTAYCPTCGAQGPKVYGMGDPVYLREKALLRALKYSKDDSP